MKKENKERFVKGYILFCFAWGIFSLVFLLSGIGYNEKDKSNNPALVVFLVWGVFVVIMVILMATVDLNTHKTVAEKYPLTAKNFDSLKSAFESELTKNGFQKEKEFDEPQYKMTLYLKFTLDSLYVFALMKTDELTVEAQTNSTKKFWKFTSNYNEKVTSMDVHLIHCICVNRITPDFRKFVDFKFGRYQLPVGISFGGQTAYIAVQKDGWFKGKYKHLRKLFLKLIANQVQHEQKG